MGTRSKDEESRACGQQQEDNKEMAKAVKSPLIVVVDTNIFLNKTKYLKDIINTPVLGGKPPTLLVPWVVFQELDSLKKNTKDEALSNRALQANSFISDLLMDGHPYILGQSAIDAVKEVDGWSPDASDDKVLHCCVQTREKYKKCRVVLLSDDKNLCGKACATNVKCFDWYGFLDEYKINFGKLDYVKKRSAARHAAAILRKRNLESEIIRQRVNEIMGEVKKFLMDQLVPVLEKESKAAYQDIWLRMFPVQPPWTLSDVFTCLLTLWGGVFGLVLPRWLDKTIKNLKSSFKNLAYLGCPRKAMEIIKLVEELILELHKTYGDRQDALSKVKSWKAEITAQIRKEDALANQKDPSPALKNNQAVKRRLEDDDDDRNDYKDVKRTLTNNDRTSQGKSSSGSVQTLAKQTKIPARTCSEKHQPVSSRTHTEKSSSATMQCQKQVTVKRVTTTKRTLVNEVKKKYICNAKLQRTNHLRTNNKESSSRMSTKVKCNNDVNTSVVHQPQQSARRPDQSEDNVFKLFDYVWQGLNYFSGLALDSIGYPHQFGYAKPETIPSQSEAFGFLPKLYTQLNNLETAMKSALASYSNEHMLNFLQCLIITVPQLQNNESTVHHFDVNPEMLKAFCMDPKNRELLENGCRQLSNFLTVIQDCIKAAIQSGIYQQ